MSHLPDQFCAPASPLLSRPAAMSASGSGAAAAPTAAGAMKKAFPHVDLDGHNLPPSPAPSSPRTGKRYAIATELVYTDSNDQYNASSVPIYQVCSNPTHTHIYIHESSADRSRAPRSSKPRAAAAENMITLGPEIPPELTSNDTSPRSCRRSAR